MVLLDNPQPAMSLHDQVLARYSQVTWANASTRSIIHTVAEQETVTAKLEAAVNALEASVSLEANSPYMTIPGISVTFVRKNIQQYLHNPNAWWHTDMIDAVLEATEAQTTHTPRGYRAFLHVNFDPKSKVGAPCTFVEDLTPRRRPWTCLPRDWLSKTTTGVLSSKENTHFVAIAIFGPQKLVIVYDGREGRLDAPGLWKVRVRSEKVLLNS